MKWGQLTVSRGKLTCFSKAFQYLSNLFFLKRSQIFKFFKKFCIIIIKKSGIKILTALLTVAQSEAKWRSACTASITVAQNETWRHILHYGYKSGAKLSTAAIIELQSQKKTRHNQRMTLQVTDAKLKLPIQLMLSGTEYGSNSALLKPFLN